MLNSKTIIPFFLLWKLVYWITNSKKRVTFSNSTHVFVTARFAKHIFLASDVAGVTILLHRRHLYEFFRRARVNARRAPGARPAHALRYSLFCCMLLLFCKQISTIIALFCLLLIHVVRIAPFPFDGLAQQNEDFAYRDSDQTGNVIEERNALRRNRSKKNYFSLFHHRVTRDRDIHSCVLKGSQKVEPCGDDQVKTVTCRKTSWGCNSGPRASPDCEEIREYFDACGKALVTDCKCK